MVVDNFEVSTSILGVLDRLEKIELGCYLKHPLPVQILVWE